MALLYAVVNNGARITERELLQAYRVVVLAESPTLRDAAKTLGVAESTLYRQGFRERDCDE